MNYEDLSNIYHRVDINMRSDEDLRKKMEDAGYTAVQHSVLYKALIEKQNTTPEELDTAFKALRLFYLRQVNDTTAKNHQIRQEQREQADKVVSLFLSHPNDMVEEFQQNASQEAHSNNCYLEGCEQTIRKLDQLIKDNGSSQSVLRHRYIWDLY